MIARTRWVARIALLTLVGCHGYLANDRTTIPSMTCATLGGQRLETRSGSVFLEPAANDIEALLGVGLADEPSGVRVTNVLRSDTALEIDDHIVSASLLGTTPLTTPRPSPKKPGGENSPPRTASPPEAITSIDILRRYTIATGATLALTVLRDGHTVVVEQTLDDSGEPTTLVRFNTGELGFETCEITDWPRNQLPAHAEPLLELLDQGGRVFLVTRVEQDSPTAVAGLRPLDVFGIRPRGTPLPAKVRVLDSGLLDRMTIYRLSGEFHVIHADGESELLPRRPNAFRHATDIWIPLLFSWESDGVRTHIGLGPLDVLFHYSSDWNYDARTDQYQRGERWSLLTTIQSSTIRSSEGKRQLSGAALIDVPRWIYAIERWVLQRREDPEG